MMFKRPMGSHQKLRVARAGFSPYSGIQNWAFRGFPHLAVVIGVLCLALVSSCSSISYTAYRSPAWSGYTDKIAVLPLVVAAAAEDNESGSYSAPWITKTGGKSVSDADYAPAEAAAVRHLTAGLDGREVIEPFVVNRAMKKKQASPLSPPMAAGLAAKRTKSQAALLLSLRDYKAVRTGPDSPSTTADVHLALYDAAGKTIWTLSAPVTLQGDEQPPTLAEFVDYASGEFAEEMPRLMEGL